MRYALFWVITQLIVTTMWPIACPEMSGRNYHYTLPNEPEERSSLFGGSFFLILQHPTCPRRVDIPEDMNDYRHQLWNLTPCCIAINKTLPANFRHWNCEYSLTLRWSVESVPWYLSTPFATVEQLHIHHSTPCLLTQAVAQTRARDAENRHDGVLVTLDVEMFMTASREWRLF